MKVVINALSAKIGGGVTYMKNFPRALAEIDLNNEYIIFVSPRYQKDLILNLPKNFTYKEVNIPANPVILRMLWEQFILPVLVKGENVDILYSVTEVAPLLAPCKVVIAIRNPNIYADLERLIGIRNKMKRIVQRIIAYLSVLKASRVVFVSSYSVDFAARKINIPPNKVVVVYHGVSDIFRDDNTMIDSGFSWLLNKPYILTVSSITKHKNYSSLLKAFALLVKGHNVNCSLVIAGEAGDKDTYKEVLQLMQEEGLSNNVHVLGKVQYDKLPAIYRAASVFVLSSYLETFGHPLVEAMASCIPIVASNSTVIPEICQDAALYFDPDNIEEIAEKIWLVISDRDLRDDLTKKGLARSKDFSWEGTARRMVEVFESIYDQDRAKS